MGERLRKVAGQLTLPGRANSSVAGDSIAATRHDPFVLVPSSALGIESQPTQPLDRAVMVHQRGGLEIPDHGVIADPAFRTGRSHLLSSSCRHR